MDVSDESESLSGYISLELETLSDQEPKESGNSEHGSVQVMEISLKPEYMKIQRKKVEGSQQRIEDGIVYFTVFSPMQIVNVRTFVQRFTDFMEDITLNRPENGWSELYTRMMKQKVATYDYMADLDSVYKSVEGNNVYGLFKNKGSSIKNIYVFFVMVELLDQTVEELGLPFLLKTKPVPKSQRAHGGL